MSKALAVLKLFFSLVSINSTDNPQTSSLAPTNSTAIPITRVTLPMPFLINPVDSIASYVGQAFEFKVPDDTFHPVGKLKFSMLTVNRGMISSKSWLRFNSKTRIIYGLPLKGNAGKFQFRIKASNEEGMFADNVIDIHVQQNGAQYNHEFVLKTAFDFSSFVSNVERRFDFMKRLVRFTFRNSDFSTIWLKSYDKDLKQIKIAFNTIRYSPCDKNKLENLLDKFVTTSGGVRRNFQKVLSKNFPITSVDLRYFGPCDPPPPPTPPPFEWGILKHVMPILMLLFVIGLPVGISCAVKKRIKKKKAILRDQLRKKRREEQNGFTFHTVHYNNRYPSMLSVSNNSREDDAAGDSDNSSSSKIVANGSVPASNMNGPTTAVISNGPTNAASVSNGPTTAAVNNQSTAAATVNNQNKPINVDSKQPNPVNLDKQSRIVYMGKSDMNIPVYFTKPKEQEPEGDSTLYAIAGTISSTIKGIGKSVLNIAGQGEEETPLTGANAINVQGNAPKDNNVVLLSSELQLPVAVDASIEGSKSFSVRNIKTDIGKVNIGGGIPKRSQSELKLSDLAHHARNEQDYGMFDESSNIAGTLMSPHNVRLPKRRLSMPQLDTTGIAGMDSNLQYQPRTPGVAVPLKSCLKNSQSSIAVSTINEQAPLPAEGMVIGNLTHQIEQMSREVREDFGSKGIQHAYYPGEHIDGGENSYQDGGASVYTGGEPAYYQEEELNIEDEEAMDYTTWRRRQIQKAEREAQMNQSQTVMHEEYHTEMEQHDEGNTMVEEIVYEDYTNPYQYSNGFSMTGRSQSTYLPANDYDWSEDYEKENRYKQQPPSSPIYGDRHYTHSMPSLNRDQHQSGYMYNGSKVDNTNKLPEDEKSLIGKLFSREKPEQNKNLNVQEEAEDGSLVGFLKTRVGGILGPSSEGSSWFK